MSTENNQLVIINDETIELLKTAPEILKKNQERSKKIMSVANVCLNNWKVAYTMPEGPEKDAVLAQVDNESKNFIEKAKQGFKSIKEDRSSVTQIMDEIKKYYTACENDIDITKDTTLSLVQKERDKYVTFKIKVNEERELRIKNETAKKNQGIELKGAFEKSIADALTSHIAEKKIKINNFFNSITLLDFDEKSKKIINHQVVPPTGEALNNILNFCVTTNIQRSLLTDDEVSAIKASAYSGYNFEPFTNKFQEELITEKNKLVSELHSKKAELEEIAEKERKAQAAAEEEKIRKEAAEKIRLQQLADEKDLAVKKELEKKQAEERAAEERAAEERAEALEKEKQDILDEQKKREEEEARRIAYESEISKQQEFEKVQVNTDTEKTLGLFEEIAQVTEQVTPNSKSSYEIKVSHSIGYMMLMNFWYEREGKNLSLEKIAKRTFAQAVAFAEKHAKSTGEMLEQQHVKYNVVHKAK